MNTQPTTIPFTTDLKTQVIQYIDSFGINWHCIDNLGEASNFIHSFKRTQESFEQLKTKDLILAIENIAPVLSDDEMAFTEKNRQIVLNFLNEAQQLQESFVKLDKEPNFVENLATLKTQSAKLNYLNARAIIYHICLA